MSDLVVIFRTPSPIEADVVRGLLDAHGIPAMVTSDMSRNAVSFLAERAARHGAARNSRTRRDGSSRAIARRSGQRRIAPFGSELGPLEQRIGYRFRDRGLLEHALTHRSRVHEDASGGVIDNESLEFLGDSVLGFVIADLLFRAFPQHNEGQKSKLKASLVSAASLARLGERIGLGEFLILGRGEEKTGGRKKQALIADGYEALIAAIYLDGGIEPARAFIERQFEALIAEARRTGAEAAFTEDYKSALQEWLQSHDRGLPVYRLVREIGSAAPPARSRWKCWWAAKAWREADGRSKKEAAQAAAKLALDALTAD